MFRKLIAKITKIFDRIDDAYDRLFDGDIIMKYPSAMQIIGATTIIVSDMKFFPMFFGYEKILGIFLLIQGIYRTGRVINARRRNIKEVEN